MSEVRVKVKLTFPESEVRRAVLATLVRRFDVEPEHPAGRRRGAPGLDRLRDRR